MKNKLYGQDGKQAFHILICLIQVWDKADGDMVPPANNTLEIAEVESIEISDSYRQLINKAKVRFPRGTVIRKTSETVEDLLEDARKVTAEIDNRGILLTTRKSYSAAASVADFSVGKRIRIYLGYTTDPHIASLPKFNSKRGSIFTDSTLHEKYFDAIKASPGYSGPIFDGYVTKCSIDTPIELECEDLASVLKQFTTPNIEPKKDLTVNDLLAAGGKYDLLKDTGFELYPETKSCDINIGKVLFTRDLTLADVLTTWSKNHLYAYVYVDYSQDPPKPYIVVGRSYFTLNFAKGTGGKDSILKQRERMGFPSAVDIDFNYNVADNGLTLVQSNKDFLCVQGQCFQKDNSVYHISLIKNPDWKEGDSEDSKWRWVNESKLSKKKQRAGQSPTTSAKIDMNKYTVVPYVSRKIGCTPDELKAEMIAYYEDFHTNGIEGSLTLFGDLQLQSGIKVHLIDPYYPAKNGMYFIDEVTTKFGLGGFRQTIRLPYCIKLDSEEDEQNNQ